MKKRVNIYKVFATALVAVLMIGGMVLPTVAATPNGYATAEEMRQIVAANQKALDEAIASGRIPKGTTVDECYFSTDKNGHTSVVTIAEVTANNKKAMEEKASTKETATTMLSEAELEAYAQEVFELVNKEREKAGMSLLDYDYSLQDAAMIRASECASVNNVRVDGKAHTRPDGSRWFTVLGIDKNYNYGENAAGSYRSPKAVVEGWMESAEHKANILREDYTDIGVGVGQASNGQLYWIQIFYRPLP